MNSTVQNGLIVLLAGGVVAIYATLSGPSDEATEAPVAATTPFAGLDSIPRTASVAAVDAMSLSEGLHDEGQWRGKPVLADLDADGNLDIVAAIRRWDRSTIGDGLHVWLGNGSGAWTDANDGLRRDMGYGGSHVGDVDGDGHLDIAYSGHDVLPHVFLGDGSGKWAVRGEGLDMEGPCADVAFGDVDGDGTLEVAALGQFAETGGLAVFRWSDEGWTVLERVLDPERFGAQVHLDDLDGDGRAELIAATDEGPRVWGFDGTTFVPRSEGLHTPEIGGAEYALLTKDFDGDGHKELVCGGAIYAGHDPLVAYKFDGERWNVWGEGLQNEEAVFDLALGDIDGDGDEELVAAGKGGILLIEVAGPGRFETLCRIADTLSIVHLATGDVNDDGRDEILGVFLGTGLRVLDLSAALGGTV